MRITLKDIAERLGITKAAVSMALRNNPRISAKRREEIQSMAKEMGYEPDPFLSRLSIYRSHQSADTSQSLIGWLNHWADPKRLRRYREFEEYWRGAARAAMRRGYRLEEIVWPVDRPAKEVEQELIARGFLGLLIPPHLPDVEWQDFDWNRFSLIRFGMSVRKPDSNLVTADLQRAVVMAVQKIHDHGYRRIGLVFNREHDRSMGGNLYGGYLWAHRLLGLGSVIPPLNSEMKSAQLAAGTKRGLRAWLKEHAPDAILVTVPETLGLLPELGYRVPEDVAVACTSPYDIFANAGIDQCPRVIGQVAAEMLIKQISLNERGEPEDPCRILIESRWRDGASLPPKR